MGHKSLKESELTNDNTFNVVTCHSGCFGLLAYWLDHIFPCTISLEDKYDLNLNSKI